MGSRDYLRKQFFKLGFFPRCSLLYRDSFFYCRLLDRAFFRLCRRLIFPSSWVFDARAAPLRAVPYPGDQPLRRGNPFIVVVHAVLVAAGGADFIGPSAVGGMRRFLQFRVSADKAGVGHVQYG